MRRNRGGRPTKGAAEKLKYRVVVKLCTADYFSFKARAAEAGMTAAELPKMQGGDNTALIQKMEEIIKASAFSSEQITALINRIGQINFNPTIKTLPPDNSGIKTLFEFIRDYLKRVDAQNKQTAQEVKSLREEVAQMKTEVDTTEFEKLSHRTICEIQTQIRYLKQPPIVLKVIIGLAFISLVATWAAGYYIRDRRVWKERATYWYEQTLQPTTRSKR